MLKVDQLRDLIIKPALNDLVLYNDNAMELLVFTCAVESQGGTYLKQVKGPALGIYQMEPATHNDLWQNYIINKQSLSRLMITNFACGRMPDEERLIYDLRYATAMTRIHYLRVPESLPDSKDIQGIWQYYKDHYNTSKGAAKRDESIQKYQAFLKT